MLHYIVHFINAKYIGPNFLHSLLVPPSERVEFTGPIVIAVNNREQSKDLTACGNLLEDIWNIFEPPPTVFLQDVLYDPVPGHQNDELE